MKQFTKNSPSAFLNIRVQNWIRTIITAIAILTSTSSLKAQPAVFNGTLKGNIIYHQDSTITDVAISISREKVTAMFDNGKTESWFRKANLVQKNYPDSIVLSWNYDCSVGRQSRIYTLTNISSMGADITMRGLTIFYGDKRRFKDDVIDVTASGRLQRTVPDETVARNK